MTERIDGPDGTYAMPKDGWVCFHCGERLTTPGAARDHFGAEPGTLTGCQIKVGEERGLLMELRKAEKERDEQLNRALEAEREVERLEIRVGALSTDMKFIKPFAKCDSMRDVFNVYDFMEGLKLAAEERERVLVEAVNNAGYQVMLTDDGMTFIRPYRPTAGIPQESPMEEK